MKKMSRLIACAAIGLSARAFGGELPSMSESSGMIPPPSQHGFEVLGTDPNHLYLYHLATRNNPRHMYQMVMEASLTAVPENKSASSKEKAAAQAELAKILKAGDGQLFTMLTENKFTLHELHGRKMPFRAQLYKDYFAKITRRYEFTVQVSLGRMIYFNELKRGESMPDRVPYILFGDSGSIFAARKIYSNKKSADDVVRVSMGSITDNELRGGAVFAPDASSDDVPLKGETVVGKLSGLEGNPVLERPTYIRVTDEYQNTPVYGTVPGGILCLNIPQACQN